MQEVDAQRRLAILRGEVPPPLPDNEEEDRTRIEESNDARSQYHAGSRKRRKRVGEDDTDFELRLAKERNGSEYKNSESTHKPSSSAPIVDHAGHIDLFGDERARAHAEKNEEAEAEKKKKAREYEDQYTMRFSNAPGKHGTNRPWYSEADGEAPDSSSKDVWGNNDPKRRERDTQRLSSNDPLMMMKKGASQVRELKKERRKFQEERDEELRALKKEERRRERHRSGRDESRSKHHSRSRGRDSERHRSRERGNDTQDARHYRDRREHRDDDRSRRRNSRSPSRKHRHSRRDE